MNMNFGAYLPTSKGPTDDKHLMPNEIWSSQRFKWSGTVDICSVRAMHSTWFRREKEPKSKGYWAKTIECPP